MLVGGPDRADSEAVLWARFGRMRNLWDRTATAQTLFLCGDVGLDRLHADVPDAPSVLAAAPQGREARPQSGNSWRIQWEERAVKRRTISAKASVGSAWTNRWTCSGLTLRAWSVISASTATSPMICFRQASTGGPSTDLRDFGHQTRWYLRLKVAPLLRHAAEDAAVNYRTQGMRR